MGLSLDAVTATPRKKQNSQFINELIRNRTLYLMLMPGTLLIFLFSYLPMAGVLIAFKDLKFYGNIFESFTKSKWVGLKNFIFLFKGEAAFIATRNTILYNMAFIILSLVLAVMLAIALNELRNKRLSKFYQTTFILPHFLSWVIVAYFGFSLLSVENGVINKVILGSLGREPVNWYYEAKHWPFILIIVNIWKGLGFNSVIYLAAISGIDPEYYDAAQIDGATKIQQIQNITIPMLVPLMTILTILAVGKIFSSDFGLFFNVPLNMGTLRPVTEVIDTYVYRMMRSGDYGMASASGIYQASVGFVLVLITNSIVRKIEKDYSLF